MVAYLRESERNQGCFSRKVLDFTLRVRVRNQGAKPIKITPKQTTLTVDGKRYRVTRIRFRNKKDDGRGRGRIPDHSDTLLSGHWAQLNVQAFAILAKKRLKKADRIRLVIETPEMSFRVSYKNIRKVKLRSVGGGSSGGGGVK